MSVAADGHGLADAIIVAAGGSSRMGGADKVLATLAGRPLLAWSLDAFARTPLVSRIVVVASGTNQRDIERAPWLPDRVTQVVMGGERRQESVARGFDALRGHGADDRLDRVVLIHDAARPLVTPALIESVARSASDTGAAIPALPIPDTVKRVDGDVVAETLDRATLATAQTPQGVVGTLLAAAYERYPPDGPLTWTDEAALLEASGIGVRVVPGDPANLKVTVPADLERAAVMLGGSAAVRRSGIGHDAHPFGPGSPLRLGGIEIAGAPALHGHSDGDVALHAVADALLGAGGMGDLGRMFPAGPATPRGIDSRELLAAVSHRLLEAGWRPAGVDLTIVGARPRLAPHLDAMRGAIAALLGLGEDVVNVKASSGNLDGADGAGRSISALALATIEAAR
jgi:2-C-methyl-D-erythritol 4-phosphate cytidylyltransferase/2-C-methyl-D-erythritol 2,4-cyclodiphosphate synthase